MLERVGKNLSLDQIFEDLYNLISEANRIPLTDKIIVEESDLFSILDDLKEAIPKEVTNAGKVLEESSNIVQNARDEAENIVAKANSEAEHIVEGAKAEAERLTRQEEIVKQAEALASDIKTNAIRYQDTVTKEANDYSDQMKNDSLQYADDMLGYLSNSLKSALQAIDDNRGNVVEERKTIADAIAARAKKAAETVAEAAEEGADAVAEAAEEVVKEEN